MTQRLQTRWSSSVVGPAIPPVSGIGNFALNATATWMGVSFITDAGARTLNAIRVYVGAVSGTVGASDLTVDIYSDDGTGKPNASLGSATINASSVGWKSSGALGVALSPNTQYHMVFKDLNFTTGNFPSIRYTLSSIGGPLGVEAPALANIVSFYPRVLQTTNSGTTWTSAGNGLVGLFRLNFADGTYAGMPVHSTNIPGSNTTAIYTKRASGLYVTVPANFKGSCSGVVLPIAKTGTPPGDCLVRFYVNDTLQAIGPSGATAITIPQASIPTSGPYPQLALCIPFPIIGGDHVAVVIRQASDLGASGNSYQQPVEWLFDTDANSLALLGDWTPRACFTTDDSVTPAPSNWTFPAGVAVAATLLLESGNPYTSQSGSGGGPVLRCPVLN